MLLVFFVNVILHSLHNNISPFLNILYFFLFLFFRFAEIIILLLIRLMLGHWFYFVCKIHDRKAIVLRIEFKKELVIYIYICCSSTGAYKSMPQSFVNKWLEEEEVTWSNWITSTLYGKCNAFTLTNRLCFNDFDKLKTIGKIDWFWECELF